MSASYYRSVASNLDRIASDISACDADAAVSCRERLPGFLQGAATPHLVQQLSDCSSDLMIATGMLSSAADDARATAAAIEAAELAAAAEAAAEVEPAPEDDEGSVPISVF